MVVGGGAWALSISYITQKWAFPDRVLAYDFTSSFIHDLAETKHCDWLRYFLKSCTMELITWGKKTHTLSVNKPHQSCKTLSKEDYTLLSNISK